MDPKQTDDAVQAKSAPTRSLVRSMDVLRAVAEARGDCTPASIADATGIPRPTVYRLLETLENLGLLERLDGEWAIGYELIRLGRDADVSRTLVPRTRPALEALVAATGETAMLATPRSGLSVDVISQVDAPNLLGMMSWVGRPVPTHASVAGKIMLADLGDEDRASYCASFAFPRLTRRTIVDPGMFLAELEAVAAQGYAETIDELEHGLSGIGAPVRDDAGTLVAVIGIYGPTSRIIGPRHAELTQAVVGASAQISTLLAR
jgi:DNA-binding IclR family transcriptional regulator